MSQREENAEMQAAMQKNINERCEKLLDDAMNQINNMTNEFQKDLATTRKQQSKIMTDMSLAIENLKDELGFTHPDMPRKQTFYSLNRLIEMILEYLMILKLYGSINPPAQVSNQQSAPV